MERRRERIQKRERKKTLEIILEHTLDVEREYYRATAGT
jgi:hypothetical protein